MFRSAFASVEHINIDVPIEPILLASRADPLRDYFHAHAMTGQAHVFDEPALRLIPQQDVRPSAYGGVMYCAMLKIP